MIMIWERQEHYRSRGGGRKSDVLGSKNDLNVKVASDYRHQFISLSPTTFSVRDGGREEKPDV